MHSGKSSVAQHRNPVDFRNPNCMLTMLSNVCSHKLKATGNLNFSNIKLGLEVFINIFHVDFDQQ